MRSYSVQAREAIVGLAVELFIQQGEMVEMQRGSSPPDDPLHASSSSGAATERAHG